MAEKLQTISKFLKRWYPAIIVPLFLTICTQQFRIMELKDEIYRLTDKIDQLKLEKDIINDELKRRMADIEQASKKIEILEKKLAAEKGVIEEQSSRPTVSEPRPSDMEVEIQFTEVPRLGMGSEPRGEISGKVIGLTDPQNYKIVIYAFTDQWYVQPLIGVSFTDISKDGLWNNWTHLGSQYAAILVLPSYRPNNVMYALPVPGGDVIAAATVPAQK